MADEIDKRKLKLKTSKKQVKKTVN